MSFVLHLKCRNCDNAHPVAALASCPSCGGQLDPEYDWPAIGESLDRDTVVFRPRNIWRYRELLPVDHEPSVSRDSGWTPLIEVPRLAKNLGVGRAWLKCDGQSFPSLSFKDRVVSVAINKAVELGFKTIGCPSTGNLANAVAAHAAAAGLESWIIVPDSIELGKMVGTSVYSPHLVRVRGNYDQANSLAGSAAERFGWGIVNVNLRPFYGEGSKTMAYEIAEQLGWRTPSAVIAPMAGGSLVSKLKKGFDELKRLGWVSGEMPRIYGVQAEGCCPIVAAHRSGGEIVAVEPKTIARSIAIGNPVDGMEALRAIDANSGDATAVDDEQIVDGIRKLASLTGVFTETAGGVTMAATKKLKEQGAFDGHDEIVLCLTGNGMKTVEAVKDVVNNGRLIDPEMAQLEALL